MSQKISFLTQYWPFLNISIKAVAYLMHHLVCHHWSKFQTKLTSFWGVMAKKQSKSSLKMTVSAAAKTFENLKSENYRSNINKTYPYAPPYHLSFTENWGWQSKGVAEITSKNPSDNSRKLWKSWLHL